VEGTKEVCHHLLSVTYDPEAKALHLKLSENRVTKTIPLGEGKYLDVAESGKAVALEIIFSSMTDEALRALIGLNDEELKLLR